MDENTNKNNAEHKKEPNNNIKRKKTPTSSKDFHLKWQKVKRPPITTDIIWILG